jgi:hypothetical protein
MLSSLSQILPFDCALRAKGLVGVKCPFTKFELYVVRPPG